MCRALALILICLTFSACEDAARAAKTTRKTMRDTQVTINFDQIATLLYSEFINTEKWPANLQGFVDEGTIPKSYILDPWDQPFVYRPPASKDGRPELICIGQDGVEGTQDDVKYTWRN
jgi:hypothetical protein